MKVNILTFLFFIIINNNFVLAWLFQSAQEKLRVAEIMYEERNRPLRAEVLLEEARRIYEKKGDKIGLAHTNRIYAYFLKSKAVGNWSKMRFYDKTINHDNRFLKSIEYLEKSLKVFEEYGLYAYASNVQFNMAVIYHEKLNNNKMACINLDKSLINHMKYRKENSNKQINLFGYSRFEEVINKAKIEAKCFE